MMLRRVVYISQSRVGDDQSALNAIVEVSSARNAAEGITGMLWSDDQMFVQALEGGHEEVGGAMERIKGDPRHDTIEIVDDRSVQTRMFGTWSMVRADAEEEAIHSTAYLVGFIGQQGTPIADRVREVLLASEPAKTDAFVRQ